MTFDCVKVMSFADVHRYVLIALRTRGLGFTLAWILGVFVVGLLWGERAYLLQVAQGVAPRPTSLAEVATVMGACCVPAIADPRMWSWEAINRIMSVRIVAAIWVPAVTITVSCGPVVAVTLGSTLDLGTAILALVNSVLFASTSAMVCIFFGRGTGPLVGSIAYLAGVVGQALQIPVPAPFQVLPSWWMAVVVLSTCACAGAFAVTLGRAKAVST